MQNKTVGERIIARGTLARASGAVAGAPAVLTLNVFSVPRELIFHVDNGDSPPLALSAIQARQLPREIVFNAPEAGAWSLLVGNTSASTANLRREQPRRRLSTATRRQQRRATIWH